MIKSTRFLKKSMLGGNINKDIILLLDKTNLLFQNLKENYNNPELKTNNLFRGLYNLSENDSSKALEIINLLGDKYKDISYLAIKVKVLANENKNQEANDVINIIPKEKRKKRLYIPIYISLSKINKREAFEFLKKEIYNSYRIFENELYHILDILEKSDIKLLMNMLSDNDIIIENKDKFINSFQSLNFNVKTLNIDSNYKCSHCSNKLIKLSFNKQKRENLINNLEDIYLNGKKNVMDNLDKQIKINKYNAFIDGNNVLFYIDRKITLNSFIRLESVFNEISKTHTALITLHRRHKDYLNKNLKGEELKKANKILNKLDNNIYYTPYKMNDDWFFIWAGINVNNSLIVTNDLLRDHINKISEESIISNTLYRWITDYVVRYDFLSNKNFNCQLTFPKQISFKVQNNNDIWHLPTTDNKWICLGSAITIM